MTPSIETAGPGWAAHPGGGAGAGPLVTAVTRASPFLNSTWMEKKTQKTKKKKNEKKNEKTKKIAPPQNTPRNSQQPGDRDHFETACDETRPTCLPTLVHLDPGFVEIGLAQLSQSVKTTNVTHTLTDRRTDRPIKEWHPVHTPV